jgi:hypothetical protein
MIFVDTEESGDKMGFGASVLAGLEIPLTDLMSILIQAHGRYMREPILSQFHFSSVFLVGVGFSL